MNQDIVSEMVGEMGLTAQMAEQLQGQQGGSDSMPANYSMQGPGMMQGGPGLPQSPEEQMRLMNSVQEQGQGHGQQPLMQMPPPPPQEQQPPQIPEDDQYDDSISTASDDSTESEVDLQAVGLAGKPKSWLDTIVDYLKDPLLVIVLYIIISLTQVDDLIKKMLPAIILSSSYYVLAFKGLLLGTMFLTSRLVIS